jgi:hypothetical protein
MVVNKLIEDTQRAHADDPWWREYQRYYKDRESLRDADVRLRVLADSAMNFEPWEPNGAPRDCPGCGELKFTLNDDYLCTECRRG